jgi:hypothetical protein
LWPDKIASTPFSGEQISLFKPLEVESLSRSRWFLNRPVTRSSAKPWAAGVHGEDLLGTVSLSAAAGWQNRRFARIQAVYPGNQQTRFRPATPPGIF